ncbi:NifB/NifX family molybdenum-iron cluster-binding protein [Candidatus Omnitrophota bacterium]
MKICVTSQGETLDAQVDPRFGRCQYFIVVDPDSLEYEAMVNPNIESSGGAGIQSGQLVASKQVQIVLTGNVGPNAFETLQAGGVGVVTGVTGSIREAIGKYKQGEYKVSEEPSVNSKFGMPGKAQNS